MSREVLRDAVTYLPAKVVPALVGLLAIPILTHMLSADQYGQFVLAMTSLMLIASFCISWLVSVTIRFYIVYGVEVLFRTCRPFLVGALAVGCGLWGAAVLLLRERLDTEMLAWVGIVWIIAQGVFEYFAGWLRARNRAKAYSIALSWRSVAGLMIAVSLLAAGFQGAKVVLLGAAVAMVAALVFMPRVALSADSESAYPVNTSKVVGDILRYGIPAAFVNLVTVGLSLADRYVIGAYMGTESVAIYGASYDLAEKTIFFANSMLLLSSSVIGFRIFEREGGMAAANFLSRLMRIYLLGALPLVGALAIFAPNIVTVLLPTPYAGGTVVLPIVAVGGLLVGMMHRYSLLLSFHKRTDLIMWCGVAALFVNILSCLVLIPSHGLFGAATGTLLSYGSWFMLVRLAARKYQPPDFPWKTFARASIALLIAGGAVYLGTNGASGSDLYTLSFGPVCGLIAYALALYFMGEVTNRDVREVVQAVNRRLKRT